MLRMRRAVLCSVYLHIEYKSINTDANARGPQTRLIQKPRYEGDELVSALFACFTGTKVQMLTGCSIAGLRSYGVAPRVEEGVQAQKGYNARWRRIRHKA